MKLDEDYFLASLVNLHFLIKDLEFNRGSFEMVEKGIIEVRDQFMSTRGLSRKFVWEFSRDLGLLEYSVFSSGDRLDTCLLTISLFDRIVYL